ncbi:MAG: amidohydrolase family protein [Bacteroidota bacterium]
MKNTILLLFEALPCLHSSSYVLRFNKEKYVSQNIVSILLFLSLSTCLSCNDTQGTYFEGATCIENITLIDAANGLREQQTVVLRDERILSISNTSDLKLSKQNKIVDGSGKYLIPGLWDAHVHFDFIEELAPAMFDLFLAYGITSLRDTGGKIDFVKKWKAQSLADPSNTPRLLITGPLLDGMPNVYDGSSPMRPALSVGLVDVEAAVEKVDELAEQGVDLLKAYEMLSPEQFEAIVKRANEKGLKVTGHIPLSMDAISVSNLGIHSMEHLRNLELSMAENTEELLKMRRQLLAMGKAEEGGVLRSKIHTAQRMEALSHQDDAKTQQIIEVLASNKIWQIPTLSVMTAIVDHPFARPAWRQSFDYLPDTVEHKWKTGLADFLTLEVPNDRKTYANWMFETTKAVQDAGVGVLAGTDCPIFYLTPGLSLHGELELLVAAGLSNMEALASATLHPAQYFELEDEIGLVEAGMLSDLLILDANPLENISNTQQIHTIIKHGKWHQPAAILARLK